MKNLVPIFIVILAFNAFSQKSVSELPPKHAAALADFLSKNKNYDFLSEKAIEPNYLKFMRESFGAKLTPYYKAGDFNHDKIIDFAFILSRSGERTKTDATSEEHKFDYPLAVVIFNGTKKGQFETALVKDVNVPLVCFLNTSGTKKKSLYFGVSESDADRMIFTPAGNKYIVEYPDEP